MPKRVVNPSGAKPVVEEPMSAEEAKALDEQQAKVIDIAEVKSSSPDKITFDLLAGYEDESGVLQKTCTIREMTGRDEEALGRTDVRNDENKFMKTLLIRCVESIGDINKKSVGADEWDKVIDNLLIGDADYIFVKIRELLGDPIEVSHQCPNCNAQLTSEFDVSELEIKPFKGARVIPFELNRGFTDKEGNVHRTGKMRLLKLIDRELLTKTIQKNPAKGETAAFNRCVKFDGDVYTDMDTFSDLTLKDRKLLGKIAADNLFGVETNVDVTCSECGYEFKLGLSLANFT